MHYSSTPMPQTQQTIGILVVNLGTPDAPDTPSVRRYLKEFLSDPRVIETPRWLWWPILNLVILRIRPARSAEGYKAVWTEQGSPILAISRQQTALLQEQMNDIDGAEVFVELAMRYGQPSVKAGLDRLQQQGVGKLLVLPMYPQYCAATTASVFDAVSDQLQRRRWIPETRFINQYYQRPDYINALAASVRESWEKHGKGEKLVLSYHGIPKAYIDKGDPYLSQCEHTTALLQEALQLTDDEVLTVFQSRVGRQEWLKPYCDETLKALPASGVKSIDIISPAFSADCLETLEELEVENRAYFMQAGGERYQYIPALNARNDHIKSLSQLLREHLGGWLDPVSDTRPPDNA